MSAQLGLAGFASTTTSRDGVERDALISPCGKFRYWLSRIWDRSRPMGFVCMVNPSDADAKKDDPTVQSLMRRARLWGWGGFWIVNPCAFRSSHPSDLLTAPDPIGPENDSHISRLAAESVASGGRMVVAWGSSVDFDDPGTRPALRGRSKAVLALLLAHGDVYRLGRTADGSPTHPMARGKHRVPDDAPLELHAVMSGQKVGRIPFSKKPPHPEDRPALDSAPEGTCGWCGGDAEGRYGVQASADSASQKGNPETPDPRLPEIIPLCNTCGPGYRPTVAEVRNRYAERG